MDDIKIVPILPLSLQRRISRIIQVQDILNEDSSAIGEDPLISEKRVSFMLNFVSREKSFNTFISIDFTIRIQYHWITKFTLNRNQSQNHYSR